MQAVPVAIKPGMSEGIDPRMLPVGTPRLLQNVRARQQGRLEKRPGQTALATTGLPTTGTGSWIQEWNTLPAIGIEGVFGGTVSRDVYVKDAADQWNRAGRHGFVVPERRVGITMGSSSGAALSGFTSVAVGGLVYMAWMEASDIHLIAMDVHGNILRENAVAANPAQAPRLVYANGVLYLVVRDASGAGRTINVYTVGLSALGVGAPTAIGSTLSASTDYFDAAPMEGGTTWLIAYPEDATHIRVRVMSGTTSSSSTTIVTTNLATFVSVVGNSGGKVVVAYVDGTNAEVGIMSDTLTGATNTTVQTSAGSETWDVQSGIVRTGAAEWALVFGGTDDTAAPSLQTWFLYHARINSAGTVTVGPNKIFHFLPCAKPFTTGAVDSRRVSIVAHNAASGILPTSLQACHYILDLDKGATTAELGGISYEHVATHGLQRHIADIASLGTGQYFCPILWIDPNTNQGIDALVFRSTLVSESRKWSSRQTSEVQGALLVNGGALYEHCGAGFLGTHHIVENGFAYDPTIGTAVAAGGALTSGTLYSYVATYLWADSQGRLHRSAPSAVSTVTPSAGNLSVTVRAKTLSCSGRFGTSNGAVLGEIWRSWSGGPYYFVALTDSVLGSALSVTYTDAAADTGISANRTIYTDEGILENQPPSGARLFCVGGNRVFTVGWKERCVEFSKLFIQTAPAEFCDDDSFRIFLPEAITGLRWLDGVLVIFTGVAIYLVTGDGPDDKGVGAYSEPRRLPASHGCDDSRSILEVPSGIMFKAAGTMYLLPRGFGAPVPLGDDVQETLEAYPEVLSASLCSNDNDECAHFVLAADDTTGSALAAVYNLRIPGWTLDVWNAGTAVGASVGGFFTILLTTWAALSNLPVRRFDVAQFQDWGATGSSLWITSAYGFGDWCPFGPLGWGEMRRLVLLGEIAGACQLTLQVTVDGATGGAGFYSVSTPLAVGPLYIDHQLHVRKATSFRFTLGDAETSGKTAGLVLNALSFEAQPEEGARRCPGGF